MPRRWATGAQQPSLARPSEGRTGKMLWLAVFPRREGFGLIANERSEVKRSERKWDGRAARRAPKNPVARFLIAAEHREARCGSATRMPQAPSLALRISRSQR